MSSISILAKHTRSNSFSDSLDISDLSFAPTPSSRHTRQRSSISSIGSRSASQSNFNTSVIWNKSSSLPQLYDPGQTSRNFTSPEFSSSHLSSELPGLTSSETAGDSWSAASSSFHTSSGITVHDSAMSQLLTHFDPPSLSRMSFHRPLPEIPRASFSHSDTGLQTSTTLPTIPGYGPIRLTVTMDLPPPPKHYQHAPHMSVRVDTPMNEGSPATCSDTSLDTALDSFSAAELRQLLRLAVHKHPSLASDITSEYTQKASLGMSKTVNFVHYSNSVWHTLNSKQHLDAVKGRQYANKAVQRIANDISSVATQVQRESSLSTKKNALETLRKIGRSVCLATGVVGERVRDTLGSDKIFVDAMIIVADSFTEDDRRTVWAGGSGTEIIKRLEQLDELRRCYRVFDGLDIVLALLKREDGPDGKFHC
ncbi:hypothetical protein QM012_003954 [Aureobasidium pullulans]|uniref:Uncharacterized protein n=1 Tax=Aureobasidium pullulans TaxID=5580 RepID=A0ABR0T889_AURPU